MQALLILILEENNNYNSVWQRKSFSNLFNVQVYIYSFCSRAVDHMTPLKWNSGKKSSGTHIVTLISVDL